MTAITQMSRVGIFHLICSLLLVAPPFQSQSKVKQTQGEDFKLTVRVALTGVLVTVTNGEGAPVTGLKQQDFQVFENNELQEIKIFATEADQPLRLSLLFDSSASIATELKTQQEAAIDFLQSIIHMTDRASIFQVSEDVEMIQQFSNRLPALTRAIRSIHTRGGTSLYDAIFLAAEGLRSEAGRKVILIVSDGTDTTSGITLAKCLRAAQNSEAVVYSLIVQPIKSEPGRNLGGEHAMIFLSERTGGKFFKISSQESLRSSYLRIGEELRTQYYIGYYPHHTLEEPGFRNIEIRLKDPAYQVRAREGYDVAR